MPQRDTKITAYLRQVDKALMALSGVRYSALQDDIEKLPLTDGIRIERASANYTNPDEFAQSVMAALNLKEIGQDADAAGYNTRLVALATFVAENPEWKQGVDAAFREVGDGVARLAPWKSGEGAWGFASDFAASTRLETVGTRSHVVPEDAIFEAGGAALDIVDALAKLEPVIENVASGPVMGR